MKVNSATQVANLNSDKLDNLDASAFDRSTYGKNIITEGTGNTSRLAYVSCDAEDFVLSGGYAQVGPGTLVTGSFATTTSVSGNSWTVSWRNDATPDTLQASVLCADVGTPRQ